MDAVQAVLAMVTMPTVSITRLPVGTVTLLLTAKAEKAQFTFSAHASVFLTGAIAVGWTGQVTVLAVRSFITQVALSSGLVTSSAVTWAFLFTLEAKGAVVTRQAATGVYVTLPVVAGTRAVQCTVSPV